MITLNNNRDKNNRRMSETQVKYMNNNRTQLKKSSI